MASWHILAYALYNTFKFQKFHLKLRRVLSHCLKIMAPLPQIQKIVQLFQKNVVSKVVDYYLIWKHGTKAIQIQKVDNGISAPPEGPMDHYVNR